MTHIHQQACLSPQAAETLRLGRISYLNVLPIYYALEQGCIQHDFRMISGPPAELNTRMAAGELDISSASSIEYARHWPHYRLLPDLAIGSQGPVQSVLLLSQIPITELGGQSILISAQTHTSAALLRLLMREQLNLAVTYQTGDITARLQAGQPPTAFLAIGDEALRLRSHPDYTHALDLGQSWLEWTGLPFIFGLWISSERGDEERQRLILQGSRQLLASKDWGMKHIPFFARMISDQGILTYASLLSYFQGLVFAFGQREQDGLRLFYRKLYLSGEISSLPELRFLAIPNDRE